MEIIEIQECNIISRGNVKNHEDDSDEMKYGGGPLEQAPVRENGYYPTLESFTIKK